MNLTITRYGSIERIVSSLSAFDDVFDWLGYLRAPDYVANRLTAIHGCTEADAKKRSLKIASHAKYALQYISQSVASPKSVGFLPSYYAILNLSKIICLTGPYANEFTNQTRWHGATYSVRKKDSRSLLTEEITLKSGGSLALLYKTLTAGLTLPRSTTIKMDSVYPYIPEVAVEYEIASNKKSKLANLQISVTDPPNADRILTVRIQPNGRLPANFSARWVPALSGFQQTPGRPSEFSRNLGVVPQPQLQSVAEQHFRRQYLYFSKMNMGSMTALRNQNIKFPREFPIALMFFHMSSVVRYKPEFLLKLENSKFWPLLATGLRHGLFQFMMQTWSFFQQSHHRISAT